MYRSKDFYLKNIYKKNGKKIGTVKDIYIDFYRGEVKGLKVNSYSIFDKKNYVKIEDIISLDEDIIVDNAIEGNGLKLSEIKGLDVVDKSGSLRGVVEDILIDENEFKIKGLVISTGIIEKMIKGKEVILINRSVLGDDYILYLGDPNVVMKNIPHEITNYECIKKA